MSNPEQGTIIHIEGQVLDSLILSTNFFNQTGMVIAAPIYAEGKSTVLHIPVICDDIHGLVHLEAMKGLDLKNRYYKERGILSFDQIQNISDTAQAIFDYFNRSPRS